MTKYLPIHFTKSAKISGSFSLDQLRKSLAQVQMQHPLLRVGIAVAETGYPKFVEQIAPILLRLVVREDDRSWQREVEVELSRSFSWRTAPLFRVVLLQSERVSELIMTCHHAIANGMSFYESFYVSSSTYMTFKAYCQDRCGFTNRHSNYLIAGAEVVKNLQQTRTIPS